MGTIGWGIFIFHNSWLRSKEEDYRSRPRLSIDYHYDRIVKKNGSAHQCFFSYERIENELKGKFDEVKIYDDNDGNMREKNYDYLGIIFKNHSSHLIYSKIFKGVFNDAGNSNSSKSSIMVLKDPTPSSSWE